MERPFDCGTAGASGVQNSCRKLYFSFAEHREGKRTVRRVPPTLTAKLSIAAICQTQGALRVYMYTSICTCIATRGKREEYTVRWSEQCGAGTVGEALKSMLIAAFKG